MTATPSTHFHLPTRYRLLAVDDDEMVRLLLNETLRDEGFIISEACNGLEALNLVKQNRPDIIVLDAVMPEMDGFDFLARIRETENLERLPVVMLTALEDVESINRAYHLGATDFVTKPINWITLPHRLTYILRATENLRELSRSRNALEEAQKLAKLGNFEIDANSRLFKVSRNLPGILGIPHDQNVFLDHLSADQVFANVMSEDRAGLDHALEALLKQGAALHSEIHCHVEGEERTLYVHANSDLDSEGGAHGSIQDISEFRRIEQKAHDLSLSWQATEEEKQRNQYLLERILPKHIVQRIQAGEKMIAEVYGEVAIMFADLQGFTSLAAKLGPKHLVEVLNTLFSGFDDICEDYHVEKIKTVGDSYMAVGGLIDDGERNYSLATVLAAGEMIKFLKNLAQREGLPLGIRVGVHTGSVVGGVLGDRKPHFDLWGDTVNLASRMESNGVEGLVQISEATWFRVKNILPLTPRGKIAMKGKGSVITYLYDPYAEPLKSEQSTL